MALTYRADIDGLRALAIVPVVMFHAGVSGVSGGFVGVDVFFVISGFLITGLIQAEISEGRFSYINFWERRARRLLAPIVVVTLVALIVGSWLLMPEQLRYLGQSVVGISTFASNLVFWSKSGYFAADGETIPLLHSWSLAVEEQFYLVFPAVLIALATSTKQRRSLWLLCIAVASLVSSAWWTRSAPDAAYYLLPSRAFELMIGALLALNPLVRPLPARVADLFFALGMAMVVGAVITFDGSMRFPGFAALIPCVGTALLVIAGATPGSVAARMLSLSPFVFMGKLSYSLYLWHWPLIVFWSTWRQMRPVFLPAAEVIGLIIASILLAWLSYRWIETPIRERRILATRKSLWTATFVSLGVLFFAGISLHFGGGFPERLPAQIRVINETIADWTADQLHCGDLGASDEPCEIGAAGKPVSFVVWGDSHAQALFNVMHKAAETTGIRGIHLSRGACPPLPGMSFEGSGFMLGCAAFNAASIARIESLKPDFVVLAARWHAYDFDGQGTPSHLHAHDGSMAGKRQDVDSGGSASGETALNRLFQRLNKAGIRILLIDEVPYPPYFDPSAFAIGIWRAGLDPESAGTDMAMHAERIRRWSKSLERAGLATVRRFSPAKVLCPATWCPVLREGRPLYRDSNHLTNYGADLLRSALISELRALTIQQSDQAAAVLHDSFTSDPESARVHDVNSSWMPSGSRK